MEQTELSTDKNDAVDSTRGNTQVETVNLITKTMQQEDLCKELSQVLMEKHKKCPAILVNCSDIHIGPKVEFRSEQEKIQYLKKEEEETNKMYFNCCKKMKNKYVTYFAYMRSFLWEGKRNDFPLNDYFVDLTVEKADLFGKKYGEKIDLNDIFRKQEDAHQTILITGDPGYGKTSLCKKIAYDWATKEYLQHFQLTVFIVLRKLGSKSIRDAVLHELQEKSASNEQRGFYEENLNFLVILDGFDEMIEKAKVVKFMREDSFDIAQRITIVITSRPQAAEEIREDIKLRFSIEGFSSEHQKKYIEIMFRNDRSKAIDIISKLADDDFYREIAECPLMLHMLCCLHHNAGTEKIGSKTDLYIRMFSLVTERYIRKTNQADKFERGKYFFGENLILRLGELNVNFPIITSELLKMKYPNKEEYNFITGLDILVLNSYSHYDSAIRYDFLHHTFLEFISALVIYNEFCVFSHYGSYNTFLFLLGLHGNDVLPEKLLYELKESVFTPAFMIEAHREIKLKRTWNKFCSVSKVNFFHQDFDDVTKLLKLYEFKVLYFTFPDSKDSYELMKDKLLDFYKNYNFPTDLKIYVFLSILDKPEKKFHDICQSVSCLIDFFNQLQKKNVIYLTGINSNRKYYCFENINCVSKKPEDIPDELNLSEHENVVSLDALYQHETTTCFLLLEQYRILRQSDLLNANRKQDSPSTILIISTIINFVFNIDVSPIFRLFFDE